MATEFDSRLDALRARFAERCDAYADELGGLLARTDAAPGDRRDGLRALAHRLSGTAGTFGFTRIGTLAAEVEHLCDDRADPAAVAAACAALQTALLEAGKGDGMMEMQP